MSREVTPAVGKEEEDFSCQVVKTDQVADCTEPPEG